MECGQQRAVALLPIALFLAIFLGSGVYFSIQGTEFAFYQISSAVAVLPAVIMAILMGKERIKDEVHIFLEGVSDINVITMVVIYLLAGAYGSVAKAIGGVDATVYMALDLIPSQFILPGLFLMSSFIATAMGTSMGTIATVAPIAVATAETVGLSVPLSIGAIVGGAMFGDNLSMISDTTIAAVRTQGADLKEKFLLNFKIALPAMIITVILLYLLGGNNQYNPEADYQIIRVLPYIVVLVLALTGMNVLIVLTIGILCAGAIGLAIQPDCSLVTISKNIFDGYSSMMEIMILSMFIGGLGELVKRQGGINYLVQLIGRITFRVAGKAKSSRIGEVGISLIVSFADICTANNTVAILLSGEAAREIAEKEDVDPNRSAAFIDIFSCVFQGILPYSAQILLAGSIAGVSPFLLVTEVHYPVVLGLLAILAIIFRFPKTKST